MKIIGIAKMTSKGRITIPGCVRQMLHLRNGSVIAFEEAKGGIFLSPCKVTGCSPYSSEEWQMIKRVALERGKVFLRTTAAMKKLCEEDVIKDFKEFKRNRVRR